jgi:hypothetical protein
VRALSRGCPRAEAPLSRTEQHGERADSGRTAPTRTVIGMNAISAPTTTRPTIAGDRSRILEMLGGRRGIVDGALPPLVFVAVNAVAGSQLPRPTALTYAIGGAVTVGVGILGARALRGEPLRQALGGLAGLAIAVAFAFGSGEARGFFLPGIYVDAAYALVLAASVVVGRPLIGALWALVFRANGQWRDDPRLRRRFAVATLGWSLVYAARAVAQVVFYLDDSPGFLAVTKLALGWPLTALAVVLTLAYVRRDRAR